MRFLSIAASLSLLVAGSVLNAAPALAQDCGCVAPAPASDIFGQINSLRGQVLVTGDDGLTPAAAGSPLFNGSQVVTGPESAAALSLGGCSMTVASNSEVEVTANDGQMCVRLTEVQTTASTGGGGGGDPRIAAGLMAAGAAAVINDQVNGGKTPVSDQ